MVGDKESDAAKESAIIFVGYHTLSRNEELCSRWNNCVCVLAQAKIEKGKLLLWSIMVMRKQSYGLNGESGFHLLSDDGFRRGDQILILLC